MKTTATLGVLALLMMATGASADYETIPLGQTEVLNDMYVGSDGSVWEEINGLDGLQTEVTVLEDGSEVPADERHA